MKITRKAALRNIAGMGITSAFGLPHFSLGQVQKMALKGQINHSVCLWPFESKKSLEELCEAAVEIGIQSVELLDPEEWPVLQKYGLQCAMANCVPLNLTDGFCDPKFHDNLLSEYRSIIPKVADAGIKNLICFSGSRRGISEEAGLENGAIGLDPVVKMAEKYGITICMELFNSKVDHPDYMADHTEWGVALCEKMGSDAFKLLYDIYHMQIMEGDIIATIRKYHPYIAHYHTAGVPGRHEIDETQELNYNAIMKAIVDTGYKGFVGQEFIPTQKDVFVALREGVEICDV